MCVIAHKKLGETISRDLVAELWDRNKDGAGYLAYTKEKGWLFKKGIMEKEAFLDSVSAFFGADSELVCHMRIKTTGQIVPEHTHPFNWTQRGSNDPRYLFHNGTVKFLKPTGDSDSVMLAKMLQNLTTEEAHAILKDLSANGMGRFVTLTNGQITVFGDDESVTDNGIWFSNGRHLAAKKVATSTVIYPRGHHSGSHIAYNPPPTPSIKAGQIVSSPSRTKNIKTIANFYATRRQTICNDAFISQWSDENGISAFPDATLEQIANFSDVNMADNKIVDPMYEFLLAFSK